jgi:hypothetical protein
MPFFHFEVRTPTRVLITVGAKLPDHTAARVEAAKRIGALLAEHAGQLWVDEEWEMDVTDETGLILYSIHVAAMRSAATATSG